MTKTIVPILSQKAIVFFNFLQQGMKHIGDVFGSLAGTFNVWDPQRISQFLCFLMMSNGDDKELRVSRFPTIFQFTSDLPTSISQTNTDNEFFVPVG